MVCLYGVVMFVPLGVVFFAYLLQMFISIYKKILVYFYLIVLPIQQDGRGNLLGGVDS